MIKAFLKRVIPAPIRRLRYWIEDRLELRGLYGPAPMREFSDYDDYWQKRGTLRVIFRRWCVAVEWTPPDVTLLDVGCGTGEFLRYLREVKPGVKGEGADFSAQAVAMTASLGFRTRQLDITREPVGGVYDVVTAFEVLEHLPEAEVGLRALKAATRQRLIVSLPNVGYIGCRVRLALFGRFPTTMCILHIKEHVRHWTVRDFREWIAPEGLRVVKVEGQYGPSWSPWKRFPALFAKGLVYVIEPVPAVSSPAENPLRSSAASSRV